MAPLPYNSTDILKVEYDTTVGVHQLQFRRHASVDKATFITTARSFCSALASRINTSGGFTSATYQAAGSNVSLPESWTLIAGTNGTAPNAIQRPEFVSFLGRTAGGRRVRLAFFDMYLPAESDWRLELGDVSALNSARTVLTTGSWIAAVDGMSPIWYPYFNIAYSAYWTRKSRQLA